MKNIEDSHRALRLLEEISSGEELTQRDLSDRAGVALGLVNSYLKNLVSKGYVKISGIPTKRYRYYLTPKGFIEKSRLTYDLLHNYTRVFREARREYTELFARLHAEGVKRVLFAGVDEVAEIAYLSLHEVNIEFAGCVDDRNLGEPFFRTAVLPMGEVGKLSDGTRIIITTYHRKDHIYGRLLAAGVSADSVESVYPLVERSGKAGRKQA